MHSMENNEQHGGFHDTLEEWNWPSMELHYFPENTQSPTLMILLYHGHNWTHLPLEMCSFFW
jgi:hypothetical protein